MICAQNVTLHNAASSFSTVPTPNDSQQALLRAAGVTLPDALPVRTARVVTRKSLVSERK